jgi:hypothetical protein
MNTPALLAAAVLVSSCWAPLTSAHTVRFDGEYLGPTCPGASGSPDGCWRGTITFTYLDDGRTPLALPQNPVDGVTVSAVIHGPDGEGMGYDSTLHDVTVPWNYLAWGHPHSSSYLLFLTRLGLQGTSVSTRYVNWPSYGGVLHVRTHLHASHSGAASFFFNPSITVLHFPTPRPSCTLGDIPAIDLGEVIKSTPGGESPVTSVPVSVSCSGDARATVRIDGGGGVPTTLPGARALISFDGVDHSNTYSVRAGVATPIRVGARVAWDTSAGAGRFSASSVVHLDVL